MRRIRAVSGAIGSLFFPHVAAGRKMDYADDIFGTEGAPRFLQQDQNAQWCCDGIAMQRPATGAKTTN